MFSTPLRHANVQLADDCRGVSALEHEQQVKGNLSCRYLLNLNTHCPCEA